MRQRGLYTPKVDKQREAELQAQLVDVASMIRRPPLAEGPWAESAFAKFRMQGPNVTGGMHEKLVRRWLERNGVPVVGRADQAHDMRIRRQRVEVKGSCLQPNGKRGTKFWWNGIRESCAEIAALVGLEPGRANIWVERVEWIYSVGCAQKRADGVCELQVSPEWLGIQSDGTLVRALELLSRVGIE